MFSCRFIICIRLCSSWLGDKAGSYLWNCLFLNSYQETVKATSCREFCPFSNAAKYDSWLTCSTFLDTKFALFRSGLSISALEVFPWMFCWEHLGSCKMEESHTKIYVPNSVEMHLLNDCEDLVFMQCKLVSDVIDRMQTNLSQETPYLANFLKILMT